MKRPLLFATGLLLFTILIVVWQNQRRPSPISLTPSLTGKPEYCLTCHSDLPEISPSHPVQAFGCVICHGGERLSLNADVAHSSMHGGRNPSSLEIAELSCGGSNCHTGTALQYRDHVQRVRNSIQATYTGAITSVRYTHGAQDNLTALQAIYPVQDYDPKSPTGIQSLDKFDPKLENNSQIQAFAQNCLTCHLSAEPLPGVQYTRLTGCAACHTPNVGIDLTPMNEGGTGIHRLTTAIPYTQCNTCHNRGKYDPLQVQFLPRSDQPTDRLHDYYLPGVQFALCEWTLDCADCHTRSEVMGDGHLYNNQKEIQYVQCRTCHGTLTELPRTRMITSSNDIALRMAFLNPVIELKIGDTILTTENGEPLWNVRKLPDGSFEMFGKASGERFTISLVKDSACQQKPDQQEARYCRECHAVTP